MSDVTLVAKVNVKFGGEGHMDPRVGFVRTKEHTSVAPGKEFTIDAETAEELVASGAAMSKADYEAEQRAAKSPDDRLAEMRQQIADADRAEKLKSGDSIAINENAHLESQKKEDAAVEEAQKKAKGGKDKGTSGYDDKEKTKDAAPAKK